MREYTGKVYIEKESKADRPDTATESGRFEGNPHGVKNVNQPQGPRVGNEGAHKAKRGNFLDAKAERQPLADMVVGAFDKRYSDAVKNGGEHEFPREGSIDENSQVKRFAAKKSQYRD